MGSYSISDKVCPCINIQHLKTSVGFGVKFLCQAYTNINAAVLHGSEPWPLKTIDVSKVSVFELRCLLSIGRICWDILSVPQTYGLRYRV